MSGVNSLHRRVQKRIIILHISGQRPLHNINISQRQKSNSVSGCRRAKDEAFEYKKPPYFLNKTGDIYHACNINCRCVIQSTRGQKWGNKMPNRPLPSNLQHKYVKVHFIFKDHLNPHLLPGAGEFCSETCMFNRTDSIRKSGEKPEKICGSWF